MGQGNWRRGSLLAALTSVLLIVSAADGADPRAAQRFRTAAALQDRALYDLAAAEYASLVAEFPADPLAEQARFQRGVCLFQLARYDEAVAELRQLPATPSTLDPPSTEQCYAYLGLAEYNLAQAAKEPDRSDLLDAAVATLDQQLKHAPHGSLAPQAEFYRAEALYARGRLAAAIEAYRQLLQRNPQPPQRADALFALGVTEQEHGEFAKAARTLEDFRKEFPEHSAAADAQVRCGEALLAHGQHCLDGKQAQAAADALAAAAALPRWSKSDAVLLALSEAQQALGKPRDAIQTLDRLLAEFPECAATDWAYWRRGECQAAEQNWPAAVADFNELVARFPDSELAPQALVALARAHVGAASPLAAEASLDEFLARFATHELAVEAHLLRATIRHQRGEFAGGIADTNAVLAGHPPRATRSKALHVRGLCELGLRKPADAAATLAEIVAADPQYPTLDRVLYDLAWAYQESQLPERATATFARLAETRQDSPLAAECRYRVGAAQFARREFSTAVQNFRLAAESSTDDKLREQALHQLAWCQFEEQKFAAAQQTFEQQVAEHPQGSLAPDAHIMAGECRFQQQQFAEALEHFAAVLDQPAANESLREMALVHAGQCAAQLDQWQHSLELLDRSLRDFPHCERTAEARCERATALYELERFEDAQREFAAVAAHDAGVLAVRAEFMLGQIHLARKQYDEAVRMFFKAAYGHGGRDAPAAFHHWQAEAIYAAARALEATGRADSARTLYQELVERYPKSARATLARQSLDPAQRR